MPAWSILETRWRQWCRAGAIGFAISALVVVIAPGAGALVDAPVHPGRATSLNSQRLPQLGRPMVVETDDVGDPFILPVPAGTDGSPIASYVLFWTTDWRSNVPTAVSTDLVHWHRVADALPVLPTWAVPSRTMTWGPSAVRIADGWVLYFSTEDAANRLECIGAAFSHQPTGPYVDTSAAPLICQSALGGSIDPSVTHDGSGSLVLVWKSDGNARHLPVGIWEQGLTADGQSLTSAPERLIGATQLWEHRIVEGPALLADTAGGWWLFYSGGSWQSNTYDTGVAWCATPAGPCRETSDVPLLSSLPGAISPGGLDTFVDSHGKLWAAYSAFPSRPVDARAAMAEDHVLELSRILSH